MKKILLLIMTIGITILAATAQNTQTTQTGVTPIYNGSANTGSAGGLNNTNTTTQPASGSQNNVNSSYRSHYQPTTTKPATITPQAPATTPNSAVPGGPVNQTTPPISK